MIVQSDAGYATQVSTAVVHLRVVEERLVALVDLARGDLARARRAGARAARVREVHALLLGLVKDVDVVGALDGRLGAVLDERHGVVELERRARSRRALESRGGAEHEGD